MKQEHVAQDRIIPYPIPSTAMLTLAEPKKLLSLREQFCANPATDLSCLRSVIARSWRRSILSGVRPEIDLNCRIAEPVLDADFLRVAHPVVQRMRHLCEDIGGFVCITDAAGTLAQTMGSHHVMKWADRLFPLSGGSMSEEFVGTNSDGAAIEEGMAVQVWGAEHFHDSLSHTCCTSVPIRDPIRRNIRAVISLALPAHIALTMDSRAILMTVQSAAAEITQQILAQAGLLEQTLLTEYLREIRKRGTSAVVAIGGDTTIASKEAKFLLRDTDFTALLAYSKALERFSRQTEHKFPCASGVLLNLQIRPVALGHRHGLIIRIRRYDDASTNRMIPAPTEHHAFRKLQGNNLQFQQALRQLSTAVTQSCCVHITGEPGVGKTAAAQAYAEALALHPQVYTFSGERDADMALIHQASLASNTAYIFRHVDRAHPKALTALQSHIIPHPKAGLALTSTCVTDAIMPLLKCLQCVEVHMPALRVRRDDIPILVNHFIVQCNPAASATAKLIELLSGAEFSENIAQLREIVYTAVDNAIGNRIDVRDLSEFHKKSLLQIRLSRLQQAELKLIREAIAEAGGNRAKAATLLRIGRSTLYRKIDSYTTRGFDI